MTFYDYFCHDLFKFSMTVSLAVSFEDFQIFLVLAYFLTLNSSKDTNSGVHQNTSRSRCLTTSLDLKLSLACFVICSISSTKQNFHFP